MIEVRLADGRVLQFPDGTPEEVVKAAARRMMGPAGAEIPSSGPAATEHGSGLLSREDKRAQMRIAVEHGDLGHVEVEDPGLFGVVKAGLKENVVDPMIGLAARANPVSIGLRLSDRMFGDHLAAGPSDDLVAGLRESIHDEHRQTMEDYLAQNPSSLPRQAAALGTDFATSVLPVVPGLSGAAGKVGAGAARLGARLAPEALAPGSAGSQLLARGVGGALEGGVVGLGKADPNASFGEQAKTVGMMAGLGGGMGMLGGARSLARQQVAGDLLPSGLPKPQTPPPPTRTVREQIIGTYQMERAQAAEQAAQSIPTLVEQADVFLKAREQFPQLPASARPAGIPDTILDELSRVKAQEKANPAIPAGYSAMNDAKLLQAVTEAAQKRVDAKWQPQFAFAGLSGDEALAALADKTQEAVAPPIQAPPVKFGSAAERGSITLGGGKANPPVAVAEGYTYQGNRKAALMGPSDQMLVAKSPAGKDVGFLWFTKEPQGGFSVRRIETAKEARGQGVARQLYRSAFEAAGPYQGSTALTPDGQAFVSRLQATDPDIFGGPPAVNPEAGFLKFGGKPPAAPPDPMDALVRPADDTPSGTAMDRLKALGNRLYLEFIDKEAAPLKRLEKINKGAADYLSQLQSRARGAGGMAELPVLEGTYLFDRQLNGSRRTGDGLAAILGGADSATLRDLDHFMAGQRHLELAQRQEQARLSYDWQRAQRLESLRTARAAHKTSLASMAGDIRTKQAEALRTARNEAKARGEYRAFLLSEGRISNATPLSQHRNPARSSTDLAAGRVGSAGYPAAQARTEALGSIRSGQRVAMGIRDQAAKARLPAVDRPPGIDLKIDPAATAIVQGKLAELQQRYGPDPADPSKVNVLEGLADKIREWSVRAVIDPLVEVGRLSAADKQLVLGAGEKYAPLFRLVERLGEDPEIAIGSTKASPIRKISGGLSADAPAQPPLESFVQQAQRVTAWVERQRVRNFFAEQIDASPVLQAEFPNVTSTNPAGQGNRPQDGTFVAWRNGTRSEYAAPADVMTAFERIQPRQVHAVLEVAVVAARLLRAGATAVPGFAVKNPLRDQQAGGVYGAEFNYRPFVDAFHGFVEMLPQNSKKAGSFYRQWQAQGGALSTLVENNRPRLERTVADVSGKGGIAGKIGRRWKAEGWAGRVFFPVLAPLEHFSQLTEKATRVGAFRKAVASGASPMKAAQYSRDVTLDFGRSGGWGQQWNAVEAFANAELQDANRFYRALKTRPVPTTIKALAYLSIPAAANYFRWKDDEIYSSLPEWEKTSFYHLAKREDGTFIRMPRPLGMLNLTYSYGVQKFLEALDGEHPEALADLRDAMFTQTPAHFASLDILPTIVQPAVEAMTNYSMFKRAPIVPAGLQGVLPEDQALDSTTGIAQGVGNATGISPLKVDYLIRGYGATWGATAASVVSGGPPATGLPTTAKDLPLVGAFVSPSALGFGSDPVTRLYKLSTEAAQAHQSMKIAMEGGDTRRYQQIVKEHPEALLSSTLTDARTQLSDLRDMRNAIRRQHGMNPKDRQDALLQIDQAATQLAAAYMHGAADYLRGERP